MSPRTCGRRRASRSRQVKSEHAERLVRRALAIHRQAGASAEPDVAEDLDVLAMAFRPAGRTAAALAAIEESLSIRVRV